MDQARRRTIVPFDGSQVERKPEVLAADRVMLKLHQCQSLQYSGVLLALFGSAKNRFGNGLDMRGTDGVRQRGNRRFHRIFHDADYFGRKRFEKSFMLGSIGSQT